MESGTGSAEVTGLWKSLDTTYGSSHSRRSACTIKTHFHLRPLSSLSQLYLIEKLNLYEASCIWRAGMKLMNLNLFFFPYLSFPFIPLLFLPPPSLRGASELSSNSIRNDKFIFLLPVNVNVCRSSFAFECMCCTCIHKYNKLGLWIPLFLLPRFPLCNKKC